MSQLEKLKAEFRRCSSTFKYQALHRLLMALGYEELAKGKTGGSRRKFVLRNPQDLIMLDEPHNGVMGPAMVRRIQKQLSEKGLI